MAPKLTLRNPAGFAFSCGRGFSDLTGIVFLSFKGLMVEHPVENRVT
jgi:hypothetical protein